MIDKSIFIIITMYILSSIFLGAQYMADSYGITLRAPDGTPIRPAILDFFNTDTVNIASLNVTNSNESTFILDPVLAGATSAWQLFQILTGTTIFNLISLFGIPAIFIVPIVVIYVILMIITLIAKIRGV